MLKKNNDIYNDIKLKKEINLNEKIRIHNDSMQEN